jgi:glycerophosphoryl diester phosphodiesterase
MQPHFELKRNSVPETGCTGVASDPYSFPRTENTLLAFQHAVDEGAGMLELDVFMTIDNQVVVSHDNELSRLTG